MSSVLQADKSTIEEGKLLNEAINRGLMSFSPDLMMSQITKNYQLAERLYGHTILKLITGYSPDYLKRNINIPEFTRELTKIVKKRIEQLQEDGVLNAEGAISEEGYELASYVLYIQELQNLLPAGAFGQRVHKRASHYGERQEVRRYHAGDRFKDLAIKESVRTALRRGRRQFITEDLRSFDRQKRGEVFVLYGLDASGSMKGRKLEAAKKAGVALAHQAITMGDHAGLIVFGSDISQSIAPTKDMKQLLQAITRVRARRETEFAPLIERAIELFPNREGTKHLVILTDAVPTVGEEPRKATLQAVARAKDAHLTISLVGIGLDKAAEQLAREMVDLGEGRLYAVNNLTALDTLVLEDYYSVR